MESLDDKIKRVTQEEFNIVPYNFNWPKMFEEEKYYLLSCLPSSLIKRIEHFGSTSIPDMVAKPIIDILVEVTSLDDTKQRIVPILESQGYDYFWRPSFGDDIPPFYAWFIKRDQNRIRTHHIHMIEHDFTEFWDRLLFRDYLIEFHYVAEEYKNLKLSLVDRFNNDRVKYTEMKNNFITEITQQAVTYYSEHRSYK